MSLNKFEQDEIYKSLGTVSNDRRIAKFYIKAVFDAEKSTGEARRRADAEAQSEAKDLRALRHPLIVQYKDDFIHKQWGKMGEVVSVCIVLEKCNKDLRDVILEYLHMNGEGQGEIEQEQEGEGEAETETVGETAAKSAEQVADEVAKPSERRLSSGRMLWDSVETETVVDDNDNNTGAEQSGISPVHYRYRVSEDEAMHYLSQTCQALVRQSSVK